jgi:predicted nucleic-acid-binding Zn-ribbon protein
MYLIVEYKEKMKRGFTNRRCPKCGGNLFVEEGVYPDIGGDYQSRYEWCLQCGYQHTLQTKTALADESEKVVETEEPISI